MGRRAFLGKYQKQICVRFPKPILDFLTSFSSRIGLSEAETIRVCTTSFLMLMYLSKMKDIRKEFYKYKKLFGSKSVKENKSGKNKII